MNIEKVGGGVDMEIMAKLPIGIENFEKMRTGKFYYVDKTGFMR